MAKVAQNVVLSPSRGNPVNKLELNQSNVRRIKAGVLVEDRAENMQRVCLHTLDYFRAFQALRDKGQGEEATAADFFVILQMVKQCLKLASVVPALLEVYAEDGMKLKQLMAFTLNPDHPRQEQVWDAMEDS